MKEWDNHILNKNLEVIFLKKVLLKYLGLYHNEWQTRSPDNIIKMNGIDFTNKVKRQSGIGIEFDEIIFSDHNSYPYLSFLVRLTLILVQTINKLPPIL